MLCVACLLTAFGMSKLLGYDVGTAAGLLAGAFSKSTVIGTAGEAINRLAIADAEKATLVNNIPVAYAVTYLVGTATLVWFIPTIGPKLMGINLLKEAGRMRSGTGPGSGAMDGTMSAARPFDVRAYCVTNQKLFNKTIAELEALPKDLRAFIVRVRSDGQLIEPNPELVIRENDVIAVIGRQELHTRRSDAIGPEVSDPELLDLPVESLDVVVANRAMDGKTLADLARLDLPAACSCPGSRGPGSICRWHPVPRSTWVTCCAWLAPYLRSSAPPRSSVMQTV